jgi:hypothetical protein
MRAHQKSSLRRAPRKPLIARAIPSTNTKAANTAANAKRAPNGRVSQGRRARSPRRPRSTNHAQLWRGNERALASPFGTAALARPSDLGAADAIPVWDSDWVWVV